MKELQSYREAIEAHIQKRIEPRDPHGLYDPMVYIMNLGGKRLRPILTLLASELFGGRADEALDAALAVEVFHNFSLVHDDIMDEAPLRRGKPTVHVKWDQNTGILSGDLMLIYAYKLLQDYPAGIQKQLTEVFTQTAIEVCEGQQWDVEFEGRSDVTLEEYIRMIQCKTGVLLGCALKMGAIVAGAETQQQEDIYRFGLLLGTAFQLQDDYLDTFGDAASFGKRIGGDIVERKKTYLVIDALRSLPPARSRYLRERLLQPAEDEEDLIREVTDLFREGGADEHIREEVAAFTSRAEAVLQGLQGEQEATQKLQAYSHLLMERTT